MSHFRALENSRSKLVELSFDKSLIRGFYREFHELTFGNRFNHIRYNAREIFSKYLNPHSLSATQ